MHHMIIPVPAFNSVLTYLLSPPDTLSRPWNPNPGELLGFDPVRFVQAPGPRLSGGSPATERPTGLWGNSPKIPALSRTWVSIFFYLYPKQLTWFSGEGTPDSCTAKMIFSERSFLWTSLCLGAVGADLVLKKQGTLTS